MPSKNHLIYALKCVFLGVFFCFLWLYFKIPMGLWGVYSSFIVLNSHTAATVKKGLQRITSHIIIAVFTLLATLFFMHGIYFVSIILIVICFFILGYFLACGENMRYIGTAGGIGLGIMLFEYPFQNATLEISLYRAGIIIFSGLFGLIFDNLVFPSKTIGLLENSVVDIFTTLNLIQKNICSGNFTEALKFSDSIDKILIASLKYSNDLKFSPIKLKEKLIQLNSLFSLQKELIYQYKSLLHLLLLKKEFKLSANLQHIEQNLNEILSLKLQNISSQEINFSSLMNTDKENELLAQIRTNAPAQTIDYEQRAFVYSRISKMFQILSTISHFTFLLPNKPSNSL